MGQSGGRFRVHALPEQGFGGGSIPLPFDLGGGCQLLVSPDAARSAVTNAVGDASLPLIIPNQPALIGVNMYFQWVVIDPASPSAFGVTVSEGAAMQM